MLLLKYKIKYFYLLFLCFSFSPLLLLAQTPEKNLEKYWNYRERLRKHFIAISPNNEKGTNIPAACITGTDYKTLSWGDGNGCLQYYIGLLATEYKLLKLYNQDYTSTRNELLYALKALERLDKTAEKYFRNPQEEEPEDLNGFFIRDDVNDEIKKINTNLKEFAIGSTYINYINETGFPYEQSKDNVWHYLPNLALVVELVDDDEIKNYAQKIVYRMINSMHKNNWFWIWSPCNFFSDCWPGRYVKVDDYCWRIINPVTQDDVRDGPKVDEVGWCCESIDGLSYGFAEAGGWITKKNLHYGCSDNKYDLFTIVILMPPIFDTYSYRSLLTTSGISLGNNIDTYDFLVNRSYRASIHPYEHFALIYTLLHGKGEEFSDHYHKEFNRYENLLNSAPDYGTYNFGKNNTYNNLPTRPENWSVSNRLVWPENINKDNELGYYNGIDYMLLHNLFWLAYIAPETNTYNKYNCNTQYLSKKNKLKTKSIPKLLSSINYSYSINYDGIVKLSANNKIESIPSLSEKNDSSLITQICSLYTSVIEKIYPAFEKNYNNDSCNFLSLTFNFTRKLIKDNIENVFFNDENKYFTIYTNPITKDINIINKSESSSYNVYSYNYTGEIVFLQKRINDSFFSINSIDNMYLLEINTSIGDKKYQIIKQ